MNAKAVRRSFCAIALLGGSSALATTGTLSALVMFNGTNGSDPEAGLVADSAGNLYGTTVQGGANGFGTVYEIAAGTQAFSTLVSFNGSDGSIPYSNLIVDTEGNLYGTTESGGSSLNYGTVYEVAAGTHALTTLATFNGSNGSIPIGGLVTDSAGNLYGTTNSGGSGGSGTVFEIAEGTHTFSTLASFDDTNGSGPYGSLIRDSAGNLIGTTTGDGFSTFGTVFQVAAGTHLLTTLATFNGTNGSDPWGGLYADAEGNLYGTTMKGGTDGVGTIFEIAAGTDAFSTLASFDVSDGAYPRDTLIADAAGNLYGTTDGDGSFFGGTAFEFDLSTDTINTLATFADNSTGDDPDGALIADAQGNLYGTATAGGLNENGTVFELSGTGFAVVPEPNSLSLLGLGALALRRRHHSKRYQ